MIKIPSFTGFEYEKESYDVFVQSYDKINATKHDFGVSSDPDFNIYGFSIGDLYNKPTIFITGAAHGSEWQSAYWVRGFLLYLSNPSIATNNSNLLNKLLGTFSFMFIPVMTPYGFEYNSRPNANGVDFERNFPIGWDEWETDDPNRQKGEHPFSEPETQVFRDIVLGYKPFMVLDCHGWGAHEDIATYSPSFLREYEIMYKGMLQNNRFISNIPVTELRYEAFPLSANWVATLESKNGTKIFPLIPEIGNKSFEKSQSVYGMNMLLIYCLYAYNYFHKRTLIP